MQASQLPFEIIACIASFLTVQQKLSCITVCQAWRTPFEESLWHTLVVGSRTTLETICDLSNVQNNVYRKNGHLVKVLKLMVLLRDDQLRIVQECFSSLKQLNTIGRSLTKSTIAAETDWSYWGSLTCLIIQIDDLKIQIPVTKLLEILSFLPCLKHLDYFKPIWSPNPVYTLQDFETLHSYLPQLRRLSVSANFAEFTQKDVSYITKKAFPVNHLAELFIDSCQVDLRWLYYFARKYTNLNTIKWRNSDWKVPKTIYKEEAAMLIKELPSMFPHIKTVLNMSALPKDWAKFVFWDPLSRSGVLLDYIRHGLYRDNTTDKARLCSSDSMRACLKSVQSLYVEAESFFSDPCSIPMAFDFCCTLVNLDIDIHGSPIAIDLLLDKCKALKKLNLIVSSVTTTSDMPSTQAIHALQDIGFEKATISAVVLNYISSRCLYLGCMRMHTVKVFGKMSHDTKSLLIDMSYTRFNLLELNNVMFYASTDGICDSGNAINILQLVRPNFAYNQPPKSHDLSMILPRGGLLTMLLDLRWFHIYKICKFYYRIMKLQVFGQEPSDSKTSFESYHHINKLRVGHKEVTSYACNQDYTNGSIKDINRGYASLRCGHVKKYDMGNLDSCERLTLESSCKTM
ncbi:hypothetical protein CLU79DRAFT_302658 [Phycomyces nitens]|nr:hypothetical protein CLU79DRAFT_302658 [Phycomyces nitens]